MKVTNHKYFQSFNTKTLTVMAKKPVKRATKAESKPIKKTTTRTKALSASTIPIEKACEDALAKLKALKAAPDLQADIQWCLGSYRFDKNPTGLYEMGEKALTVLTKAATKNAKAVSKKLLTDLEKALKSR
jgi:hypothetical protein